MSEILLGFLSDPRVSELQSNAVDRLSFEGGTGLDHGWTLQLSELPHLAPDESRDCASVPFLRVRLHIGLSPSDDLMPTLATDVVWKNDWREVKISFAIFCAQFGTPSVGGLTASTRFRTQVNALGWAAVGDETYIIESRMKAASVAGDFAKFISDCAVASNRA